MGYRGRHRKPSTAGRNAARIAVLGVTATTPLVGMTPAASAHTVTGIEAAIIQCESGGDPRAQNPSSTASGLYQFIDGTWRAYGGSTARAKDASVAEQQAVFARAFAAEGTRPWNASRSCWSRHSGPVTVDRAETPVQTAPVTRPRWTDRAPDGSGSYVCDDAHLYFEACDPANLGQRVDYPLYSR